MHPLDWVILLGTLGFIVGYGVWATRRDNTRENYLRSGGEDRWWTVGLSVMATQASAITFLSTPGQGYADGLRFVQFYFGLPLAMVVIGAVFIPLFYKWKVYTAYEFIGRRFDRRARLLTAGLFLIQRSLAAGVTIYAPAIILSKVLGRVLYLGVIEQDLHRTRITRRIIDDRGPGSPKRVCVVSGFRSADLDGRRRLLN